MGAMYAFPQLFLPKKAQDEAKVLLFSSYYFVLYKRYCLIFIYGWISEHVRLSESCVLIGYTSGQDHSVLILHWSPKKIINNLAIIYNEICSFLHLYWPQIPLSRYNTQKIPSPYIILTLHFIIDNAIKVTVPRIINIFTHSFNWIVPCSLEPLISLDHP